MMFIEHFKNLPAVVRNSEFLLKNTLELPSLTLRRSQRDRRGVRDFVLYLKNVDVRYRIGFRGVAVEYGESESWRKVFIPNSRFYSRDLETVRYAEAISKLLREYSESRSLTERLRFILKNPRKPILLLLFLLYIVISTLVVLDVGT